MKKNAFTRSINELSFKFRPLQEKHQETENGRKKDLVGKPKEALV